LFDVYYDYNKVRKVNTRKRKMLNIIEINDYNMQVTPKKVRELIQYGKFLTKKEIRREKLKILNGNTL
jgi:hypothetical protein